MSKSDIEMIGYRPASSEPPMIRTIGTPKDTGPAGDIFVGQLMGQMDLAAGSVATLKGVAPPSLSRR
jgi:acyl-CoA hydrolase